jgi:hypothetical protein
MSSFKARLFVITSALLVALMLGVLPAGAITTTKTNLYPGQVVRPSDDSGLVDCSTTYESYVQPPMGRWISSPFTMATPSTRYSEASQRLSSTAWLTRWDGSRWVSSWASASNNVQRRYRADGSVFWYIPGHSFPLGYVYSSQAGDRYFAVGVYYRWSVNGVTVGERWVMFGNYEYRVSTVTPGAPLAVVQGNSSKGFCKFP